ncbi:hypothetical protein ACFL1E_06985 [Candidatus Omnitrophota bacterium]
MISKTINVTQRRNGYPACLPAGVTVTLKRYQNYLDLVSSF